MTRDLSPVYSFSEAIFLILNLDTKKEHDYLQKTIDEDIHNYTASEWLLLRKRIDESRKEKFEKWIAESLKEMEEIAKNDKKRLL
jgi:hypothetical protein